MPKWNKAAYASLSQPVQEAYDAYREAYERAIGLGKRLKFLADSDWIERNPNGSEGRFCAFNVTNGELQWAWVKKKPKNRSHKSEGVDVPGIEEDVDEVICRTLAGGKG